MVSDWPQGIWVGLSSLTSVWLTIGTKKYFVKNIVSCRLSECLKINDWQKNSKIIPKKMIKGQSYDLQSKFDRQKTDVSISFYFKKGPYLNYTKLQKNSYSNAVGVRYCLRYWFFIFMLRRFLHFDSFLTSDLKNRHVSRLFLTHLQGMTEYKITKFF